jgi:hypothetical protein
LYLSFFFHLNPSIENPSTERKKGVSLEMKLCKKLRSGFRRWIRWREAIRDGKVLASIFRPGSFLPHPVHPVIFLNPVQTRAALWPG